MQKSGFFNAILNNGIYDRTYNAEDYSDNLAVVISNGVLRISGDDLKVTAEGMVCTVGQGRGWIEGHYYRNDAPLSFAAITAPIAGSRYDRIILRLNTAVSVRKISLVYVEGEVSNTPEKPAPVRSDGIYDLVLADIFVAANAQSLEITDTRPDPELCGWVYSTSGDNSFFYNLDAEFNLWFQNARDTLSSVSLFKRYMWRGLTVSTTNQVQFDIPQYDDTCFIEVYVNGFLQAPNAIYSLSGDIITFLHGTLVGGTEVVVYCYKSIDGTGIESVSDEITELQNKFATVDGLQKFTYRCTGLNDNISLSQIAQALYSGTYNDDDLTDAASNFLTALGGLPYVSGLADDAKMTIDVVGNCHVGEPFAGTGAAASRYRYFSLGSNDVSDKKITFDFAKCSKINVACNASSSNVIVFGTDLYIRNADIKATPNGSGCSITMFAGVNNSGKVDVDKCRLQVNATELACIATHGDFTDCFTHTQSAANHAFCFDAKNTSLIRVNGGTHYAYHVANGYSATPFRIGAGETNGVILANNVNCPTKALAGYKQPFLAIGYAGSLLVCNAISLLNVTGANARAENKLLYSKP